MALVINRLPAKQSSKCRPLLFWRCWVVVNPGFSESGLSKRVYSKPDLSSVAPPHQLSPFARLFLAVPVALFWLWVFVLWISA